MKAVYVKKEKPETPARVLVLTQLIKEKFRKKKSKP